MGLLDSIFKILFGEPETNNVYQRIDKDYEVDEEDVDEEDIDELCDEIDEDEYIENLHIGRSWILPQMVAMGFNKSGQFSAEAYVNAIQRLPYHKVWQIYMRNLWAMLVMKRSHSADLEKRARWWTKDVALSLAKRDFKLLKSCPNIGKSHKRRSGVISSLFYGRRQRIKRNFNSLDELYAGYTSRIEAIECAESLETLYRAVQDFYYNRFSFNSQELEEYVVPTKFIKAYAGDGAYSAMSTMIKFLKLRHCDESGTPLSREDCLADIDAQAELATDNGLKLLSYCCHKYFDSSKGGVFDYHAYRNR